MHIHLVISLILLFGFLTPARADHVIRLDAGVFNGRIARTESGNTVPFNSPAGTYAGLEMEYGGPRWRLLVGGTYYDYKAKTVAATSTDQTEITYGDVRAGVVLSSLCCEGRLLYSRAQVPYTDAPDANTLIPRTLSVDLLRAEAILYARAANYKLAFAYFIEYPITPIEYPGPGGGVVNINYDLGGCARIFLGEKLRYGPAICINLQEMFLPKSVVIFRQEVHGRLAIEF